MKQSALIMSLLVATLALSQTSRRGEFLARTAFQEVAKRYPEVTPWAATVLTRDGKKLYEVKKEIPYDIGYPAFYVSDDEGRGIVVSSFSGTVEFYDGNGALLRTLQPFGKPTAEYEQMIHCSFVGNRAAFLISSPAIGNAVLFVTDGAGNELWRTTLGENHASSVYLSDGGQYILSSTYSSGKSVTWGTRLFDERGGLMRVFDREFRHADFNELSGTFAFACVDELTIASAARGSGEAQWKSGGRDRLITDVRMVGESAIVLVVRCAPDPDGVPRYHDPAIVVLDKQGAVVERRELRSSTTDPPQLQMTRSKAILRAGSASTEISLANFK